VTLHTLRAEFTTQEGGRKPRGRPGTRLALAWRVLGKSVTEVRPAASCAEERLVGRTS